MDYGTLYRYVQKVSFSRGSADLLLANYPVNKVFPNDQESALKKNTVLVNVLKRLKLANRGN